MHSFIPGTKEDNPFSYSGETIINEKRVSQTTRGPLYDVFHLLSNYLSFDIEFISTQNTNQVKLDLLKNSVDVIPAFTLNWAQLNGSLLQYQIGRCLFITKKKILKNWLKLIY